MALIHHKLTLEGDVVLLEDQSAQRGCMTITNDAERIVNELAKRLKLETMRIVYLDTTGTWDELEHDGERFKGFRSLHAQTREEALEAVRASR